MARNLFAAGIASIALMTFAAPAAAQDLPEDQPFSGIYIGASGGKEIQGNDVGSGITFDRNLDGTFGDAVTTAAGANAFSSGFCNGRARSFVPNNGCINDKDSWSYYARIGLDKQFGPFVVGAVGEFGRSEVRDDVSGFSTTPASYIFTREVNWEASARLRAGFAANTTLFYGTGGAGYVDIDHSFSTTNAANAFTTSGDKKEWGYVVGGGVEQKIGRNFSIGLEYTYHDYKDNDFRVRAAQGTAAANNPFVLAPNTTGTDLRRTDDNFRWHSLRATAAFRF